MCLKQRREENRKADRRGEVDTSVREKTRIENRGPLY
jgi:hypothetical protein